MTHNHRHDAREPAFQFHSAFKYTPLSTTGLDDDNQRVCDINDPNDPRRQLANSMTQSAFGLIIISFFYLVLLVTFPLTIWFCLKRVKPLERCVVFRLGKRLPLKGPGFVISFPFIDTLQIVDLNDHMISLVEEDHQLLTNDGSIVQFTYLQGRLSVTNAIRSSTQLKDAKFSAETFVRVSFVNMIASCHLDDLEKKPDHVMRAFEENCNLALNNWGWEVKFIGVPKLTVINRADPFSPIVGKIKELFNPGDASSSQPSDLFTSLMNINARSVSNNGAAGTSGIDIQMNAKNSTTRSIPAALSSELNTTSLLDSIQTMANKYSSYITRDIFIEIEIKELNSFQFFKLEYHSGQVKRIEEKPKECQIHISAKTTNDLNDFVRTQDKSKVEIFTSLF